MIDVTTKNCELKKGPAHNREDLMGDEKSLFQYLIGAISSTITSDGKF